MFLYRFSGAPSFPLSMVYATESELMHHDCVQARRGIVWLDLLGDIK